MRFPGLALTHYRFTILVILLLLINGIISFISMPRAEDPDLGSPGCLILIVYPGASPQQLEKEVVIPIEEQLKPVTGIDKSLTTIKNEIASLIFRYQWGIDQDEKFAEIVRQVNSIQSDLPDGIEKITLHPITTNEVNIYQFALVSETASTSQLHNYAKRLESLLKGIYGIAKTEIHGIEDKQVTVAINSHELANMKIPLSNVLRAIREYDTNIPPGEITIDRHSYNVQLNLRYENLESLTHTVIHAGNGVPVYLGDVAEIYAGYKTPTYRARFNGYRAVFVTAQQLPNTNLLDIDREVMPVIETFRSSLPGDITLHTVFNQSESVRHRIRQFFFNLVQGMILVGIIIWLFVGFKASVLIMLVVPIAILIGLGMVDLSGFGIQQITIAGLIVALGMLVDNAIVVVENVVRLLDKGYSTMDAAIQGAGQVGWPIVSATLTTVLAFLPLANIQDPSGDFIKSLPVTVIFTITASLLLALTLTPLIASRFFSGNSFTKKNLVQQSIDRFVRNRFKSMLRRILSHPWRIVIIATILLTGAIALVPKIGISFFPYADKPFFRINIYLPAEASLDATTHAVEQVEAILKQTPWIKHFASNIGKGNPKIYYNLFPAQREKNFAQILVKVEASTQEDIEARMEELRATLASFDDAVVEVKPFQQGPPTEAPILFRILGEDYEKMREVADDLEEIIRQTPGTRDIDNRAKQLQKTIQVEVDKDRAAMLGIPAGEISRSVRAAIAGLPVATYYDVDGSALDIIVRLNDEPEAGLEVLRDIYLQSISGALIPLNHVATVKPLSAPAVIQHFNLQRSIAITAETQPGYNTTKVTNAILEKIKAYPLPEGISLHVSGEVEQISQSMSGIGKAAIIAFIGIFAVLVVQFRSFIQPLVIFTAVPFALIGAILMIWITGNDFSFTAMVGLTSLIGIVVNDSIILIDFINQSRRQGAPVEEALLEAAQIRFVPIVLTSLTTIAGLLPLTVLGGSLWAPMGWTIIGGLTTSTVLILIVVPALYRILINLQIDN